MLRAAPCPGSAAPRRGPRGNRRSAASMPTGRTLIALGGVLLAVGALLEFFPALSLGRLPGDFAFGNGSVRLYVPIATSIVLSLLLTLASGLFARR
jgi:hypothetical protein